ncbi:phosphatidylserine decarboxylase 2 PWA37_002527 [Arxiozyma heterogenica]|uniref:phosphatidylserine decarboxylase 2 n=1 Tax=Arxiozyma heterogenica TaxID=278026 RepID=UPI002EF7D54F
MKLLQNNSVTSSKKQNNSTNKPPTLLLHVSVLRTKNIEVFQTFRDCCPVCYISTNKYVIKKTNVLQNSNSNWNQLIKLHLPKYPNDDKLRIVIYDLLPGAYKEYSDRVDNNNNNNNNNTIIIHEKQKYLKYKRDLSPTRSMASPSSSSSVCLLSSSQSSSSVDTHIHNKKCNNINSRSRSRSRSNSNNNLSSTLTVHGSIFANDNYNITTNTSTNNRHIYIGETQISINEIFRDSSINNQFNFNQLNQPKWYILYDKKREKVYKDSKSMKKAFPVGEIQLGFLLTCSQKRNFTTLKAFILWEQRLNNYRNKKLSFKYQNSNNNNYNDDNDSSDQLTSSDISSINSVDSTSSSLSSFISLGSTASSLCVSHPLTPSSASSSSSFIEIDSAISNNGSTNKIEDNSEGGEEEEEEEEEVQDSLHILDLQSLATALDEYDVVDPTNISKQPFLTHIKNANSDYATDSDISSNSDTESILSNVLIYEKNNQNKLLSLKKRSRYKYNHNKDHFKNYSKNNHFKIFKRKHSLGVIYMEIVNIIDLPVLKNKLSRKNYDMDPFVIITFGRRVFKTSSKYNTLNPYFNEFIAFEIFPSETRFNFHFKVMDRDSISFHDEIAEYNLSWIDILSNLNNQNKNGNNFDEKKGWIELNLPLNFLYHQNVKSNPILTIKIKYSSYLMLKREFWEYSVYNDILKNQLDVVELMLYLDRIGSFTDNDAITFFHHVNKSAWAGDQLTREELIQGLVTWKKMSEFRSVWECPNCLKIKKSHNNNKIDRKLKISSENDIFIHFALCLFEGQKKLLKPTYISSAFASKRWFSKILIKLSYGKYALGSNNANILVQDRDTGIIVEEKISAHVKVGLRIIYNGKGKESKNFKYLLKTLSVRQGRKFDNPASVKQIDSFIKFHHLDMSQCLDTKYSTFNEFFYRKLKPGSRVIESHSPQYITSPADSRLTVFSSIESAKEIWIKSSSFTLKRLTNNYNNSRYNDSNTSLAIFRLAPQDYHRFHAPCDVTIGKPIHISGEYYTVNPIAIRSALDVFGENVRTIIPMVSEVFGEFLMIAVGAMMVGSIVLTCKEGDFILKGEELGYFKFGGSTIILLIPKNNIRFDSDLIVNSTEQIETLVKVGMSVGHVPGVKDIKRKRKEVTDSLELDKIKSSITITEEDVHRLDGTTWQYNTLTGLIKNDYGNNNIVTIKENETQDTMQSSTSIQCTPTINVTND